MFGHRRKIHPKRCCPVEGADQYLVYTRQHSEEDFKAWMQAPKRPAASGSTLWSFEVVQSAGPKA